MIAKIKILFAVVGVLIIGGLASPAAIFAATSTGGGGAAGSSTSSTTTQTSSPADGGVYKNPDPCHPERDKPPGHPLTDSQLASCEACNNKSASAAQSCLAKNPIVKDINIIVNGLAGMVAVVSVAMIVLGGVKYSLARNNPQEVSNARSHIINAVFAMIAFMLIWALLQYLVPGGVFNNKTS